MNLLLSVGFLSACGSLGCYHNNISSKKELQFLLEAATETSLRFFQPLHHLWATSKSWLVPLLSGLDFTSVKPSSEHRDVNIIQVANLIRGVFLGFFVSFSLKLFYSCSITVICIFPPPLPPAPAKPTSLPCFYPPPWFCPCVLYSTSWKPSLHYAFPSSLWLLLDRS